MHKRVARKQSEQIIRGKSQEKSKHAILAQQNGFG
jgi:hypothetical protein